jgi:uncharacterized protein (TIGR03067 family)
MTARALLAFLLASAATAAPVPFPRPATDPKFVLKQMQGLWEFVSNERIAGKVGYSHRMFARVEGESWKFMRDGPGGLAPTRGYTIRIDPKKTPAWIDFKDNPADAQPFLIGVFLVAKDEMRVTYVVRTTTPERPTELKLKRPAEYLLTLKRVSKP